MTIRDQFATVATQVSAAVQESGEPDLTVPTPCTEFDLKALINHFTGTTTALARVGRREDLDAEDPYGSSLDFSAGDWQQGLAAAVADLAAAWSEPAAWDGDVDMGGNTMPAAMVGEMAFAEIALHGWDFTRACGQEFWLASAGELLRSVEETGKLGRQMGAYGQVVSVGAEATEFERALAASGRDPGWSA